MKRQPNLLQKLKNAVFLSSFLITEKNRRKTYLILGAILITILVRHVMDKQAVKNISNIVLTYLLLYITQHVIKIMILSGYRKRNKFSEEHYDNLTIGISYLMSILHVVLFTIYLFYYFNVDVLSLLTIIGIFFAGLSWLLKDYIVNIINGLIIMFSRNLMIGNYVLINGYKGIIKNITFIYTTIKTDEGNLMYIPNTVILSNEVLNYSQAKTKNIVFNFDLSTKYFNKVNKLNDFITKKVNEEYPELVKDFDMRIGKIKTKSVNIVYQVTLKKYTFNIEKEVTNFIKQNILEFIHKNQEKEKLT